jgi:hypothetical protein
MIYALIIIAGFAWGGFVLFSPVFNYLDEHKKNDKD